MVPDLFAKEGITPPGLNAFRSLCKCKLCLAERSYCNIQLNHGNLITHLYNMLTLMTMGNPIQWKGIWRVECTEAHCSCQLILFIFQIFYFLLG